MAGLLNGVLDPVNSVVANAGSGLSGVVSDLGNGVGSAVSNLGSGVETAVSGLLPTLSLPVPTLGLPTFSPPISLDPGSTPSSSIPSASLSSNSVASASISLASIAPSSAIASSAGPTQPALLPDTQSTSTDFLISTAVAGAIPSQTAASSQPKSFLQNKPLAGAVFGLAGLLGLIGIFVIITWGLRRRRNGRLLDEAINFEPTVQHTYAEDMERLTEKRSSYGTLNNSAPYINNQYQSTSGVTHQGYYNGGSQAYNHPYPQFTPPSQLVNQA